MANGRLRFLSELENTLPCTPSAQDKRVRCHCQGSRIYRMERLDSCRMGIGSRSRERSRANCSAPTSPTFPMALYVPQPRKEPPLSSPHPTDNIWLAPMQK